jgi:hypothetical protein
VPAIPRRILIHLGQPRAWSTSLQYYFEANPHINYLGFRPSFLNRHWYEGNIGDVIEFGIRFESQKSFDANFGRYKELVDAALTLDSLNVLSCEALTFKCFPGENETSDKLQRLQRLTVGSSIELLYLWRNPEFLLKSLYREFIRFGLSQNFEDFLKETHRLRAMNFSGDLCGQFVLGQVRQVFSGCPVHVYSLLEDRQKDVSGVHVLLELLVGKSGASVQHQNKSLNDEILASLLTLNRIEPRLLSFENCLEHHRMFPSLATDDESWVWENARRRKVAVDRAKELLDERAIHSGDFMSSEESYEWLRKIGEDKLPP